MRIRRSVVVLAAIISLIASAQPAHAAWTESFGNVGFFDRFTWDGQVLNTKSFYLIDRVGNGPMSTSMHQGMAMFANQWNAELQNRGLYGILPAIAYYRDDANAGQCTSGVGSPPQTIKQIPGHEYSFVLACSGAPTGDIGVARGNTPNSRHIRGSRIIPYVYCAVGKIGEGPRSIEQYRSCWAHEVGHLIGVPHNNTQGHLMNTNGSGALAAAWFPPDVWQKLLDLYPEMWQD